MSNLLEQASLVMIPSGYKEDVVYSEIPLDGSGDMTFTRASDGTRINSQGLVEVVPWNLVQNSENFDAVWTKYNGATVTVNAITAPNGTTTADLLIAGATQEVYSANMSKVAEELYYTFSCYAKLYNTNVFKITASDFSTSGVDGSFNLSTVTATYVTGATWSNSSASIESVGNGWYRCILTSKTPATTGLYLSLYTSGTNSVSGVYIWGAQVNIGSTAKPYFPTTDRLNVPRLTYQNGGGGCPSLLLEKQSTNLFSYSTPTTSMGFNGTLTQNASVSPDGTQNASSFVPNTGSYAGIDLGTLTTSAQSYTFSAYLKGTVNGQKVRMHSDLNGVIQTNTITTDWVRYTATFTGAVGAQSFYFLVGDYLTPSENNLFYVYGAQLEVSSYATSLIPTNGSSATRVADACYKTGISSLIGQTSGSVFFDFTVASVTQPSDPVLWYMKDGGSGERYVELYSNSDLVYAEIDGSGLIASITKSGLTVGRHKCAIAYAPNDMTFYVDGVQIGTDTSGTPNGFSTFGLQYYLSVYTGQQQVNQCAIFPTRLTNSELASLTTI